MGINHTSSQLSVCLFLLLRLFLVVDPSLKENTQKKKYEFDIFARVFCCGGLYPTTSKNRN
jgi:hypothetical protein